MGKGPKRLLKVLGLFAFRVSAPAAEHLPQNCSAEYLPLSCAPFLVIQYAHSACLQHWCDEKRNTLCEICHKVSGLSATLHNGIKDMLVEGH